MYQVFPDENLIIIGNGFDLNLGLKTSYSDFINSNFFSKLLMDGNFIAKHLEPRHTLQNWIDIENELKQISQYQQEGYLEFNNLKLSLVEYLKQIDYSIIDKCSKAYNLLKELTIDRKFLILDFNYTKSTALILNELGLNEDEIKNRLIKVHGSVEDGNIIFGVEDQANIQARYIFLKKSSNKNFNPIRITDTFSSLHIFGHSLGETDHTYFGPFFSKRSNEHLSIQTKNINLYHYGIVGQHQLMYRMDVLTTSQLAIFKQLNDFALIDTLI